jgi:hypothetical protein
MYYSMPINMFFIAKNHWEPSFTDNPRIFQWILPQSSSPMRATRLVHLIIIAFIWRGVQVMKFAWQWLGKTPKIQRRDSGVPAEI